MANPLDPHKTICVCKANGTEVGRIAATAHNATDYMAGLAKTYGGITVDYVEDAAAATVSQTMERTFSRPR